MEGDKVPGLLKTLMAGFFVALLFIFVALLILAGIEKARAEPLPFVVMIVDDATGQVETFTVTHEPAVEYHFTERNAVIHRSVVLFRDGFE